MAVVYQILNWSAHFENFKSRGVARCSFVCVPNKQHGEGLNYILSLDDGLMVYGIWNLILGACSQHEAEPKAEPPIFRDGWLTNDGRPTGKPWTDRSLAIRWRRKESEVSRTMKVLCSEEVEWMAAKTVSADGYHEDTAKPLNGIELKGIEGKVVASATATEERKERKQPSGDHHELIRTFGGLWGERYGGEYQFARGKDGKHVKWILEAAKNLDNAKRVTAAFLADEDRYLIDRRHPIGLLVSGFNKYNAIRKPRATSAVVRRDN